VIATRTFPSYDDYIARQGGKAVRLREKLLRHLPRQTRSFAQIFREARPICSRGRCSVSARALARNHSGPSRLAFPARSASICIRWDRRCGAADWHDLPFPDRSFATVYSNSLDHCLHLDRLMAQVRRVLVPVVGSM
jgi:hypothetical protein